MHGLLHPARVNKGNIRPLFLFGAFGIWFRKGAKDYNGGRLASFVYTRPHIVGELKGDRAVITFGGVVVAAVKTSDLTLA